MLYMMTVTQQSEAPVPRDRNPGSRVTSEDFTKTLTIATARRIDLQDTTNPTSLGLAAAAAAIRNGDITSEAYTTALLQQARSLAELNSFTTINEAAALDSYRGTETRRARPASVAPPLGVPLGVKDSYLTKGLPIGLGTN